MKVQLKLEKSEDGKHRLYGGGNVRIGRNPTGDVVFSDPDSNHMVSWDHAVIQLGEGSPQVKDLNSTNGTFVNGQRIESRPLEPGDCIRLGKTGPRLWMVAYGDHLDEASLDSGEGTVPLGSDATDAKFPAGSAPPPRDDGGVAVAQPAIADVIDADEQHDDGPSPTRVMLIQAMAKQRATWKIVTALSVLLVLVVGSVVGFILWRQGVFETRQQQVEQQVEEVKHNPPATVIQDAPAGGQQVYKDLLDSTVMIINYRKENGQWRGRYGIGTGSLIDKEKKLIVTNHHVVHGAKEVFIFPPIVRDDARVWEKSEYKKLIAKYDGSANSAAIKGRVIVSDERRDLAIVQLEKLWPGADIVQLTKSTIEPGQTVHSVGNPGASDACFIYTHGKVRQVYKKEWRSRGGTNIFSHKARIVETQSPTNGGDSGGPMVNDAGELIAVTQGGRMDGARLMSFFIHVDEVRDVIQEATKKL